MFLKELIQVNVTIIVCFEEWEALKKEIFKTKHRLVSEFVACFAIISDGE